jgi:hypothetical protein
MNSFSVFRPPKAFHPVLWCAVLAILILAPGSPAADKKTPCEVRGVWLKPPAISSPLQREETFKKIRKARLNTLFVITPPMKGNKSWSTQEEFESTLNHAKALGLSVHVWITNNDRVPGGVDFTSPYEQKKQSQWGVALLEAYPSLDGVHLDYIRDMEWESGSMARTEGVSSTVRLSYEAIKSSYPSKFLTAAVFPSQPNYGGDRNEYLPPWFRSWVSAHPESPYSPQGSRGDRYVPLGLKYQQDAMGWLRGEFIDAIIPMEYTTDDRLWQQDLENWIALHDGDPAGIFIGLGWLEEKEHPDWGYDASGMVRKIRIGRGKGVRGFVIFVFTPSGERDWRLVDALAVDSEVNDYDAPFKKPAPSCLDSSRVPSSRPAP